jgi:hypothetical protein
VPILNVDGGGAPKKLVSAPKPVTVTAPKPPTTVPKAPAAKLYWFQGKAYLSASAYQAAVAAALAKQSAGAKAAAEARAAGEAARKLAEQRAEQARRADAYRSAAAAEAQRTSERSRLQDAKRREATRLIERQRRIAADRRAQTQDLLRVGRKSLDPVTALADRQQQLRRVTAQNEADRRRTAYDNLASLTSAALNGRARGVAPIDQPGQRSTITPGQQRNNELVRKAEETGDWTVVVNELLDQSRRSGGTRVDPRLMKVVQEEYVAPVQAIRDEFSVLIDELMRLEQAGDDEGLLRLVEDPQNLELYDRFIDLFGDGTEPGSFTPIQEALQEISTARERAWAIQLGMGQEYASAGSVRELVRRAERESQVRSSQLGGQRPIDEAYTDLEYVTKVLDPETGRMVPVKRYGLDAWLAREQAREADRVGNLYRDSVNWQRQTQRLLEAEDMELESVGGGRFNVRDNAVERQRTQLAEWMPDWKLNSAGIPNRIAELAANPGQQENAIREFMGQAADAYDRNMKWFYSALVESSGYSGSMNAGPTSAGARYQKAKQAWLSALAYRLGKPEWGSFEQFSATGIGGVAQAALTGMSFFPAAIRDRLQQDFGAFQPHVDVRLPIWSDNPGVTLGRSVDPNAASAHAALTGAEGSGDFWRDLGSWASVIRDNAMWGSGNVGGLLTQLTDPFLLAGPGRFMEAGRLATARAGGLAGLRSGNVGLLAREFARYSAPEFAGGAGRSAVKTEMAKLQLARGMGLSGTDALRMGDDEFRELIERAAANRTDELLKSDLIARLTESTGIEKTQLLNMVQELAPRILREYKIFAEDPFEAAARIRAVRAAAVRARSEAESAAQLARMQTERQTAMEALSRVTGRPLNPSTLTPAKLARHEELVNRYTEAAGEYLKAAERGVKAAERIELGTANARDLRGLQAQLRQAAHDIQRFEDTYRVDRLGRKFMASRGLVGRRFDQLQAFRGGTDPTAPSFVDQSLQQVRYDERRLKSLIRSTLTQLRATPLGSPLSTNLKDRLRELEQARRGLVYERALLDEGRTLMRPYVRRHIKRIEGAVTPQRVAPLAANEAQLGVGIGQDFMRQLDEALVRDVTALSDEQVEALGRLRQSITAPVDVAALLGADHAKTAVRALGRAPNLGELWTALRMAERDPLWAAEFGVALRRLNVEMVRAARRDGFVFTGMKVREAADFLWDILREDHVRLGVDPGNFSAYKALDRSVEDSLVAWRRRVAEGQVRLRERRFKPASGAIDAVFHDTDPFEVLVKHRTLSEAGSSLFAYDDLRGVLRRPMLRENAARSILDRAKARAAREAIPLDDALKAERIDAARREAIRNVEEFATRPELKGLPPETRLRAFEEKMMLDDLPVQNEIQYSQFQIDAMRAAFQEATGFSIDDKHLIARYFRGELDELPAGARRPRHGEFMVFDEAEGIPAYVVPRTHEKLADVPFGGRPRGFEDDEVRKILREWEGSLIVGDSADDVAATELRAADLPGSELSEGAAERRGAVAGRRQNAAAEARRSSRRNFADAPGGESGRVERRTRTYGWHPRAADALFAKPPKGYRRFWHYASRDRADDLLAGRRMRGDSGQGADILGHGLYMAADDSWGNGYDMVRVALDVAEDTKLRLYQSGEELLDDLARFGIELDFGWGTSLQKALQAEGFDGIEIRGFNHDWVDAVRGGFSERDRIASIVADQVVVWDGRRLARPVPDATWQGRRDWYDARESIFAGPDDFVEAVGPQEYRRWLWGEMNASEAFRASLKELRFKHIVHQDGVKAQILADAADWLWSPAAAERFAVARPHPASLAADTVATDELKAAEALVQEEEKIREALRVARQLAGEQLRAEVTTKWLDQALTEIKEHRTRITTDLYPHKAGDIAEVARAQEWVENLMKKAVDGKIEAKVADLHRLDRWLQDSGVETIEKLMDRFGVRTRRVIAHADDVNGKWGERVELLEARLKELKKGRRRASVGLSVHGDGIYIAEGTSNVTVAHELFHQFWDNEFNAAWRTEIEDAINMMSPALRSDLWQRIRIGRSAYDEAEFAAELFALWRVGDSAGSDVLFSWRDLLSLYSGAERATAEELGRIFADHAPRVVDSLRPQLHFPPMHNRSALMHWMEERGYWSPRTGEAIRSGERVWSVEEERRLFRGLFGAEPAWTDEAVLKVALNDPRLHEIMLREWGFFDDEFENLAGASGLAPEQMADALAWGKEGFKRQRTWQELRDWSMQRYGSLVTADGETLYRMPWLMKADDEYITWTKGFFDDAFVGAQRPALEAARDRLPEAVRKHLFDGDQIRSAGMEIDPRLVQAKELGKLRDAITAATRRRIERMTKAGDVEPGEWLAQEQLRFAYDVTDQLLVDPVWRGWLRGTPVAGAILRTWGQFWRMLVSWQPAFPIMNLIETYGFKRLYLTVFEGGMRPLSIDGDGRRIVESLRQIGAESDSVFHLSGGTPWGRVGNEYLTVSQRGRALAQGIKEMPVRISQFGEDRLRLDFARRVAGDTFRAARKTGMSAENAEWLARHEAKRLVESFFAISRGTGWETALNELIPFFSYNFKNKTLALRMIWQHPSVWVWGERVRREIEQANREQWAKDHPGLEFPEGPSASWLWWKVGDDYYKIDLSAFSDWTRAIGAVAEPHTPLGWLTEFIRIPHPSQLGALAIFTGEDTPWGKPGHIRELSFWADLFFWTQGMDYENPKSRRDFIQIMSQMLFFKQFGKTGMMDIKQATFFALQQLDPAQARAYLEANPDLQLYWDALPPRDKVRGFDPTFSIHYRQLMSEEENREYDQALDEFDALNARLDANVARYATQPYSDEYRAAKREAFIARTMFLKEHPILTTAWGTFMSPQRFAELTERSRVDALADAWFNWKRPEKADYDSELEYLEALVAFNERRQVFLEANPALADRLEQGRTAVETAWREQELHWTEVLDFQARLKIKIIEEEARDNADPDKIDLLYRARDLAGAELDADRFGMSESASKPGKSFFASLPGFADLRYARATPEEQRQMKRDEWYFRTLKEISRTAVDGKDWYRLAQANPAFMQEYWARNPQKKIEYEANTEYVRWMGSWVSKLQADDFTGAQAVWDAMPAWVKERYFAKHPDSGMRDGMGGGGGYTDGSGNFFRSADSRDRFLAGQAYFAAMGQWVALLKADDFEGADRYFRGLPDWMKEKYYQKHPDQRAKNDFDSAALRAGAEYFLAQGDDKLAILAKHPELRAWLAENGGDEGAMRGLIMAMYRAIPTSEPWLKRTFRERFPEVFGQEAAGERRMKKVAATLAAHPEMLPFYEKALKLQSQLYIEQLRRSKVVPAPWTMERKQRLRKKSKRRGARMHGHWSLHRDIRRYG